MTRSWKDAWTGGQYSAVRALAAGTLAVSLLASTFSGKELDPVSLLLSVVAFAVTIGFGIAGRFMAALLATAISMGDSAGLGVAARQIASLWLSVHLLLPQAPYGSFAARGRTDPAGVWKMPVWYPVFTTALFVGNRVFNAGHALHDENQVLAGIFLFVAALYVPRATGLAGWALSLGLGMVLAFEGHGSFSAAWLLHLLTFQPVWIEPRHSEERATVFYDGTCALCHNVIRFLLAEDTSAVFRIAPLGGDTFRSQVSSFDASRLPDSVVVVRGREVLVRSAATMAILESLGGVWWLASLLMRAIPAAVLDAAYDAIAKRRYRWFGRRADACPMLPPALRLRIEA